VPSKTGTTNAPGYADVADYLIELSHEFGGLHSYTICADRDRRGVANLFVVLKHSAAFRRDRDDQDTRVWSSWPCPSNNTFSAMLFRLCFELDAKLTARKLEREQQTAF